MMHPRCAASRAKRLASGPASLLAIASLLLPVMASGQSLADAAKKEKDRREKVEQSNGGKAKSYTQESVAGAPPLANDPGIAPAVPIGGASAGAPPSGTSRSSASSRDSEWRARIDAARRHVEAARRAHEEWQRQTIEPGYELRERRTGRVIRTTEELQAGTRAAKERLDTAQRALADLEEQARRANVTPGALR